MFLCAFAIERYGLVGPGMHTAKVNKQEQGAGMPQIMRFPGSSQSMNANYHDGDPTPAAA
jgi:hypothetical protein